MDNRYWIGGGFILFGLYVLLQQMGVFLPIDWTLVVGLAFVAGYFVRRTDVGQDAFPLLIVGSVPLSLFASNNIDALLPFLGVSHMNGSFLMFLGLSFMAAWGIETGLSGYRRRYSWALWIGGLMTLMGGYSALARLLHVSPAFIGSLIFPVVLIGVGLMIVTKNFASKKI